MRVCVQKVHQGDLVKREPAQDWSWCPKWYGANTDNLVVEYDYTAGVTTQLSTAQLTELHTTGSTTIKLEFERPMSFISLDIKL